MANNIFQREIIPVKPKTLSNERIFVYVPDADTVNPGIASYNSDDFTINQGDNNKVSIKWPYADSQGKVGLIGVDTEDKYLQVDDSTHLLSINETELNSTIDSRAGSVSDNKIVLHNADESAHPYIRGLATDALAAANNALGIADNANIVANRADGKADNAITYVKRINLVTGSEGTFTFTNWNNEETTLQGGYPPDGTTIVLNDGKLSAVVTPDTIAGINTQLLNKLDKSVTSTDYQTTLDLTLTKFEVEFKELTSELPGVIRDYVRLVDGGFEVLNNGSYVRPTVNVSEQMGYYSDTVVNGYSIKLLIPAAASPTNNLADKAWTNSTVATNTATFKGTYNLVIDLGLGLSATEEQIAAALASAIAGTYNNDYCYVQIPQDVSDPTVIAAYDRYKFSSNAIDPPLPDIGEWEFEFELNNSSFTADQWAAINSGITTSLVAQINTNALAIALLQANKADKSYVDNRIVMSIYRD